MQFLLPTAYSLQPTALRKRSAVGTDNSLSVLRSNKRESQRASQQNPSLALRVGVASFPSPQPLAPSPSLRSAFTLTEMLVVITIIAVLAALASVAVVRALDTAKQTRQKTEVDALDAAFKAYKEKYGSYPPCDLRWKNAIALQAVQQHFARAFPRYGMNVTEGNGNTKLVNDLTAAGIDGDKFRPDQALVFWLQGFGPDVTNPILTPDNRQISGGTPVGNAVTRTSFFDFDKSRLNAPTTAQCKSYFPQGIKTDLSGAPYLYWTAGQTRTSVSGSQTTTLNSFGRIVVDSSQNPPSVTVVPRLFNTASEMPFTDNSSTATPYWFDSGNPGVLDSTEGWANSDSFQIIGPGGDGKYGVDGPRARLYPTGTNYDTTKDMADDDNVTNFCPRARLSDAKP